MTGAPQAFLPEALDAHICERNPSVLTPERSFPPGQCRLTQASQPVLAFLVILRGGIKQLYIFLSAHGLNPGSPCPQLPKPQLPAFPKLPAQQDSPEGARSVLLSGGFEASLVRAGPGRMAVLVARKAAPRRGSLCFSQNPISCWTRVKQHPDVSVCREPAWRAGPCLEIGAPSGCGEGRALLRVSVETLGCLC